MSSESKKLSPSLLKDPVHLLALGFGTGLSPVAPGTIGTLIAVPMAFLLWHLPLLAAWLIVALSILAGIWLTGQSAARIGVHDHSGIVWDEIAAFLLLALLMPVGLLWLAAAFLAFRFFDIVKPWPIRDLDHRLHGGLGIMLDDVVAALFAAVTLQLINYLTTFI